MNRVDVALIPALLLGALAVVLFATLADISTVALASSDEATPTPAVAATLPTTARPTPPPTALPAAKAAPASGSCSISNRFPAAVRQWCDLIHQYANPAGLDENLIAAVMWQESGGNPKAYSKSGAVGLMQVMPRDGLAASFQCKSGPCFVNRPSMDQLFEPEFNVSYGIRMLAGLLEKNGSLREALRSYGPIDMDYYYADKVLKIYQDYQ